MLKLQNLSLMQEQKTVFRGLNCEFKTGQFWGIVGQNGVGKSTLLQTITGINTHYDGLITIDGDNTAHMSPTHRAQKLSYLLQDQEPCLAFSVKDAVGMGRFPWQSQRQIDQEITAQALHTCRINSLKNRSILKLSGGERRKVEIATCLAQQSEYLLLDEPLNHLDMVYRKHIIDVFKSISQDHCVIMVCHDLDVVKTHCTHVLMLMANDCYLAGTSATILNENNLERLFDDHSKHN
ncbi:MAG: ABC transporter ATP-binding protein [Marinicella sp.]